ncbi:MAG: hypothetical protein M1812_007184 [Candelaria pacifica]|nr:MAG: hypothetical protein M1812_007184 [Candelaria pacifica]
MLHLCGSFIYINLIIILRALLAIQVLTTKLSADAQSEIATKFNCTNGGEYDPLCWDALDLTSWLNEWYSTTPICAATPPIDNRFCRLSEEAWTTTFLRIAQGGKGGTGCLLLNSCTNTPSWADLRTDLNETETARYQYVRYAIYSLNFFFTSWHGAMFEALVEAQGLVENIVLTVDPPRTQHVGLSNILTSVSAGLAFLVIPEAAAVSAGAAAVARVFLTGIQQAPPVAKALWPAGTLENTVYEYGELSGKLTEIAGSLGPRIEKALGVVLGVGQTDTSTFLAFAWQGDFSKPRDQGVSVSNQTEDLLSAFTTFLVSQALVDSGWHAVMALDVDPLGLSNGTAQIPKVYTSEDGTPPKDRWKDLNCHMYDANNQCDNAWWYSNAHQSAYTLAKDPYLGIYTAPKDNKDPTDLIRTIFSNKWTSGPLLFDNAGVCSLIAGLRSKVQEILASGCADPFDFHLEDALTNHMSTEFLSLCEKPDPSFASEILQSVADPSTGLVDLFEVALAGVSHGIEHPNNTLLDFTNNGPDFSCTSQLNLTMLKDWTSVWYLHRDLHT